MSSDGDIGGEGGDRILVAEYVLGLLDAARHAEVERRIATDPSLAREEEFWRLRLAALDGEFAEVTAPAGVLPAVERRLFGDARAAQPARWWDSLVLWRGLAGASLAVAAVAVGFSVLRPAPLGPQEFATQMVAALQAQQGSGVEFVALYDSANGTVRLLGMSGQPVADKDFELWYIHGDEPAVSMGVIPVDRKVEMALDAATRAKIAEGTVLAVTLEQKGGSPTGVAQGPIVALGKATPI